ncbi:MAG: class I SAM-dependent methyltransferase [Anaerolineales bacterium]
MFSLTANFYDIIYETIGKNYELEANRLHSFVRQYQSHPAKTLLDVACGTGEHLKHLQKDFVVEGLDLDAELLKSVNQKLPDIRVHHANMLDFNLNRTFDVVACLFSSIGYAVTKQRMNLAIKNMQRHTSAGGLLVIEPWFGPEQFHSGIVHATFVNQPTLKIARMNVSKVVDGNISVLDFQYLIATPEGVNHFTEHHELGLFTHEEYLAAFQECGTNVMYDEEGLDGRGLYIGINPS